MKKARLWLKFIVIGESSTGKTCISRRMYDKEFHDDSNPTIGVDFFPVCVNVGGFPVGFHIWDTAGQEKYRSVMQSYFRGSDACLLVYDITRRDTYTMITTWLDVAKSKASNHCAFILIGNKVDLQQREVTYLEASRFAQENDMMFLETSAKTGEHVEEAFLRCCKSLISRLEAGDIEKEDLGHNVDMENGSTTKEEKKCC